MFLEPVRCGAEYEFTPCFFLGLGVLVFLDFQKATFEVLIARSVGKSFLRIS